MQYSQNFIRGMLPAEKAEEMTGVERDGDFSLHPKPSPPFKAPLFPFRKTCSAYQARRAAVDGLGASRDAQHDMARCPRRQAAGGAGMADTLRAAFLLSLPRLAFFCPERRKARGARLPMSGFWGEGEFEGEGPLFTAGKRGPSSSTYSCLRPALPWWPGRSAVPRWWG